MPQSREPRQYGHKPYANTTETIESFGFCRCQYGSTFIKIFDFIVGSEKHLLWSRKWSKVVDFGTNRKRVCDFLLIISSCNLGLSAHCDFSFIYNQPSVSHGFWHIKLHRYWSHDIDLLGSRVTSSVTWSLDSWYAVSYRWSSETIALSPIVVEILCVKHILKLKIKMHLFPFLCFRGKIGSNSILQLSACSRSLSTLFELLIATIVPRALLLQ